MPLPPVVIELSAADVASEHAPTLVEACTEAVTEGRCELGPESGTTRAVVIVSWDPGRRRAHLQIGTVRGGKDQWTSRDLSFRESDPERERWKAVGLVIGTLVGQAEREQAAEEEAKAKQDRPPTTAVAPKEPPKAERLAPSQPVPARTASRPDRIWMGVELVAGPALDEGSWRFGPGLVAAYEAPDLSLIGMAGVRYLQRPKDDRGVSMRWLELSLGPGVFFEPSPGFRLEGTTEALAQRVNASVEADAGGNWIFGMRVGLGAGLELGHWGALILGGHALGLSRGTVVSVDGEAVGRAPPLTFGASAGLRFRIR